MGCGGKLSATPHECVANVSRLSQPVPEPPLPTETAGTLWHRPSTPSGFINRCLPPARRVFNLAASSTVAQPDPMRSSPLIIILACLFCSQLMSCQLTASIISGKTIQRSRVVDERGNPLSAGFHPGTPLPLMTAFNFTDKNGYILINTNVPQASISSDGYRSFEASTKSFPAVVVLKKLPTTIH
jgi:hypothetical protein